MKKYTHFILLFGLLLLSSCNSNSSNTLESFDIENKEKRIKILSEQIKEYSKILDTEFSLFNVNGFIGQFNFFDVPGSSSLHYKMALKVEKNDLDKWLVGMDNVENENAEDSVWVNSILKKLDNTRKQTWETVMINSTPKRFTIGSTSGYTKVAIIYQNDTINEAIIFEHVIQE